MRDFGDLVFGRPCVSTSWVCFVCGTSNDIEKNICSSCGAQRPLAAQGFAGLKSGISYNTSMLQDGGVESRFWDDTRAASELSKAVYGALLDDQPTEVFRSALAPSLNSFERLFEQVKESNSKVSDTELKKNLESRREDAYYVYKLALLQFDMYAPKKSRPLRVGLMLIRQAYKGLHWLMEFNRNKHDPEINEVRDLIGSALERYLNGEYDSETYFDAVCDADDVLKDLIETGCDEYCDALDKAKSFDGKHYKILMDTRQNTESAHRNWLKAILAVHSERPMP